MKKIVITGGPSIGKTTVIELLASRGYKTLPEVARIIIEEETIKGSDVLPGKNLQKFQQAVAERQLAIEAQAEGDIVFLDRSLVDGAGYCRYGGVVVPEAILEQGRHRYDKVFLLASLGIYVKDGVRGRTLEDAQKIHQYIEEAYEEFGYAPIHVPVLPPEERVDYILERI
jgi:predicted ATPase